MQNGPWRNWRTTSCVTCAPSWSAARSEALRRTGVMRAQRSIVAAAFLVVFVLGFWVAGLVRATAPNSYDDWNLLAAVFTQVRDNYVEPVNQDKLLQSAI